jgi:hypothetical protein
MLVLVKPSEGCVGPTSRHNVYSSKEQILAAKRYYSSYAAAGKLIQPNKSSIRLLEKLSCISLSGAPRTINFVK